MSLSGTSAGFNASLISEEEWDNATRYFANNPSEVKMRRKEQDAPLPYSFIQVDGEIYAMDREYLGVGGFSKVKKAISRHGEIVKVNISAIDRPQADAKERLVTKKIDEFKGIAKATFETEKEFWKHLQGTPGAKTLKTNQKIYKIMKYHQGGNLSEALEAGIYSDIELVVIAIQCAKAVQEHQRLGIIHADIKPENFIIDRDLNVSLIDYGFSKFLPIGQTFVEDNISGTIGYMAPEIYNEENIELSQGLYSFASDIYALGQMFENDFGIEFEPMIDHNPINRPTIDEVICLYTMLTSDYGEDYNATLKSVVESKIPPMELVRSNFNIKDDLKRIPSVQATMRRLDLSKITPSHLTIHSLTSSSMLYGSSPLSSMSSSSPSLSPREVMSVRPLRAIPSRSYSPMSADAPCSSSSSSSANQSRSPSPFLMSPSDSRSPSPRSPRTLLFNENVQAELVDKINKLRVGPKK